MFRIHMEHVFELFAKFIVHTDVILESVIVPLGREGVIDSFLSLWFSRSTAGR
jgi:hypothetical protein